MTPRDFLARGNGAKGIGKMVAPPRVDRRAVACAPAIASRHDASPISDSAVRNSTGSGPAPSRATRAGRKRDPAASLCQRDVRGRARRSSNRRRAASRLRAFALAHALDDREQVRQRRLRCRLGAMAWRSAPGSSGSALFGGRVRAPRAGSLSTRGGAWVAGRRARARATFGSSASDRQQRRDRRRVEIAQRAERGQRAWRPAGGGRARPSSGDRPPRRPARRDEYPRDARSRPSRQVGSGVGDRPQRRFECREGRRWPRGRGAPRRAPSARRSAATRQRDQPLDRARAR